MLIGVISDTHGLLPLAERAARTFESLEVELVIHCGDIGLPTIVRLFDPWPTHFVLGNVDPAATLVDAIRTAGQTCHDRFGSLEIEASRIAFLHGDDVNLLRRTIRSGRWDLVCHGHTHEAAMSAAGRTLVLNPGAMCRTPRPSVATVNVPSLEATPIDLGAW